MNDIKEEFLKDVRLHRLIIRQNEGLYRHLSVNNDSYIAAFEIITWPGHLTITGDYGTYSFARTEDMFQFFRHFEGHLVINPMYWAEKCGSIDRHSGLKHFSVEKFVSNIKNAYAETDDQKRKDEIEVIAGCEDEFDCYSRLKESSFDFSDLYDYDHTDYSHQFLWCLYAIVFAINAYDAETGKRNQNYVIDLVLNQLSESIEDA